MAMSLKDCSSTAAPCIPRTGQINYANVLRAEEYLV